jgi:hypothetical protein
VDGDLYDGVPVDRLPIDAVGVPDEAQVYGGKESEDG